MTAKRDADAWEFAVRFRRSGFGWKTQPAILRIRQALAELGNVARRDPLHAAEGAVLNPQKMAPAVEQVDRPSCAIGTAVEHTIGDLVRILAAVPVAKGTRLGWLEPHRDAFQSDQILYVEALGDA